MKVPTHIISGTKKQLIVHKHGDAVYQVQTGAELVLVVILASGTQTVTLSLAGEASRGTIIGVGFLNKDTTAQLHTIQHHQARETTSNLLVKAVLTDSASFVYDGAIRVEKEGQKTNAYQRNENLVLSEGSDVLTKPSLEILADDVRCTHGATVGTIDPEQQFMLQSRGLSIEQAHQLIAEGFLLSALETIDDKKVKSSILSIVWPNSFL
jgi:Fe-S cluster assembly protein SufD